MNLSGPRPTYERRPVSEAASAIYEDALVWDMTLPWVEGYSDVDITLPRFKAAGVDLISLTVNDFPGSIGGSTLQIANVQAHIAAKSNEMVLIRGVQDVRQAKAEGKLALTLNFQETNLSLLLIWSGPIRQIGLTLIGGSSAKCAPW